MLGERSDGRLKMSVTIEELATVMPLPVTTQNSQRSLESSSRIGGAIVGGVVIDLITDVIKSFFNDYIILNVRRWNIVIMIVK